MNDLLPKAAPSGVFGEDAVHASTSHVVSTPMVFANSLTVIPMEAQQAITFKR